jgi:type II secretory pathway predicted ATPase ExeA
MLNPLDEQETGKFIEFRLRQAGYSGERSLLTAEAVKRVYDHTQGYPRQIALLCHNAMQHLIMGDHEVVTAGLIEQIIAQEKIWN